MSLSCNCSVDYEWFYDAAEDFIKFDKIRRKRCLSCNNLINMYADCLEFSCSRESRCDYEEQRFGEEVPLANQYMCEKCGEIFLNLTALGYCLTLGIYSMQEYLEEYWEITGFKPKQIQLKNR